VGLFSDDVSSDVAGDVAKLTWHREREELCSTAFWM